ncbi:MAG: hypothetical protein NMK33_06310 (plasmid) [Candidatus Cardinium sp.]|nr:MAG: hypothetical protein NMK33_06310 [Candidatus Cardinium sp.]
MEKESDKILIKNGPNQNGHWMYKSLVDEQEKGTIVDLCKNVGLVIRVFVGCLVGI